MTVFRSRPALATCLLLGVVVSISLAGLVWAQAPAENWPFDEHGQTPAAQPAPPPKSAVQKRLEELYQRDHRPLPEYMQPDASSGQSAPANSAAPGSPAQIGVVAPAPVAGVPAAASQGVRQQLSDYYQSQGKAIPAPQRAASGSQYGSSQNAPSQPGQASTTQPPQQRWYDRINPFHRSTPAAQPQSQAQSSAAVSTAANDANHSTPAPHTAQQANPPAATVAAQGPSASAPAAKSGSFWGDLTLRRAPQQTAASASHPSISVELGPSAPLVAKSSASAPSARVAIGPSAQVTAHVAVVAPAAVAMPAEPQSDVPAAHTVVAANAVVSGDDASMPFHASSEADADQKSGNDPYTGLTLEDEQNQLVPPKMEDVKPAISSAPARTAAPVAGGHHAEPPKTVPAPAKALKPQTASARQVVAKPAPASTSRPPVARIDPAAPALPQHHVANEHKHHPQTTAEKLRLIGERVGHRGLKGFCPVVLRDQRELADAKPAYCSVYRGQKYCFSSPDALARFEAAPQKYAPVAGGIDVVVKANSDQAVEGTLDFALWYKDRLYLFCSPESLQAFSISPTAYAAAAQRIY